jgi:hypothetical protein
LEIRGTNEREIERWIADLEIAGQKSLGGILAVPAAAAAAAANPDNLLLHCSDFAEF